jgi:hypothetical protein
MHIYSRLQCDTVVICAGQEPRRDLYDQLRAAVAAAKAKAAPTATSTPTTPSSTSTPTTPSTSTSSAGRVPKLFLIGGAHEAGELDAKRAIDQGTR